VPGREAPRRRARRPHGVAAWAEQLGPPSPESTASRRAARLGGTAACLALALYLTWRIGFTLPGGNSNRAVAWTLIAFEALPLPGLVLKAITLWNIDARPPRATLGDVSDLRVTVLIPTYNEPAEVIAPTIAAACALAPAHQTWVLDDGDRPWVAELCASFGARYVVRAVHDHAKAGNLNHALELMAAEESEGASGADVIAVLDCDHVPLPTFLTATLPWFADREVALVQGPQAFYNAGAFDDDGISGEQGLFFNVLMPARNHAGAGPFWCGSTSLLRVSALRSIGGVATETITEDLHTTLKLIRKGWRTVYHHQTLAVGLAPATPDQYLLQRRRWGMGAMQILVRERLFAAKRWLSWRNFHEYLTGTLWWLEGIATLLAFIVPIAVLASGAETSRAHPIVFAVAFSAMFTTRLWGARRLMRRQIHWPTAFALRVFRVPVGMACMWWLLTRRTLAFEVTPKGGEDERRRGRAPQILWALAGVVAVMLLYAGAGLLGWVPWATSSRSTVASGVWLGLAGYVLALGTRRIRDAAYATSRRNAYRIALSAEVEVDDAVGELVDISVGGAAVRFTEGILPSHGLVECRLPGAPPLKMEMVRVRADESGYELASMRTQPGDWNAFRTMSLRLFHTPRGALPALPDGVPAIAVTTPV
jgi:cellulose synthase (UDP-forming)